MGADELGNLGLGCGASAVQDPLLHTVTAVDPVVIPGTTGHVVTVDLENPNAAEDISVTSFAWSFTGQGDRTSQYTVTPDAGNPALIPAGATLLFTFLVDVSPAASLETITLDVSFAGTSVPGGLAVADGEADTPDTWDVLACVAPACGDCDGDTFVTVLDALVAAQHSAAVTLLTGVAFTNCNVTGDLEPLPSARVDILDALTLAQWAALLPVSLVCC